MALRFLKDLLRREPEERPAITSLVKARSESRFKAVSIHPGETSCEAARQMASIRFLCESAPHLPLPECDVATCSCRYTHYSDRRSGRDRRAFYDWTRERELGTVNRRSGRGRRSTDGVT
jgi:hypothetical protein